MMSQEKLDGLIEFRRKALLSDIRCLADDLGSLARALGKKPTMRPNSLGEIQGRAAKIDAACGEVAAMMEINRDES